MHLLGFYHEHTRLDRDQYITVYEENILDGMFPGSELPNIKGRSASRTFKGLTKRFSTLKFKDVPPQKTHRGNIRLPFMVF